MAKLIFCNDFLNPKKVDPDFLEEYHAAQNMGLDAYLVSHEDLTASPELPLTNQIPCLEQERLAVYRGWMLTPAQYDRLYHQLAEKNLRLVNSPTEFAHTHYLPNSYPLIESITPKSVSIDLSSGVDFNEIHPLLGTFGTSPILVKDYVKSEKHYWNEACYIPDASDRTSVENVTKRFLELRGSNLNKGLVYREFVELEYLTDHSKSGMPLTKEFRTFWMNDKLAATFNFWDEGNYTDLAPPMEEFERVAQTIKSNFFTMDIAQKKDGGWLIIELGDGQVSGLPDNASVTGFYQELKERFG